MSVHRNDSHAKAVDTWASQNAMGLSPEQLIRLFGRAIRAIEKRSLATLSSVTILVVIDRALHESTEAFPILSAAKIEPEGINLNGLLEQSGLHVPEDLRKALRHLLVELLSVLGNITADILTGPLHKELSSVTDGKAEKANREEK